MSGRAVVSVLPTSLLRAPVSEVASYDLTDTAVVITADLRWVGVPEDQDLDPIEFGRLAMLHRGEDRARFKAGAALLRMAAATSLDIPAAELLVDRTCSVCGAPHGKPRVGDGGLHVSVTHSGELVQVALSRAAPVGVDIQQVDVRVTSAMRAMLAPTTGHVEGPHEFLVSWTRLEAFLKATGEGLGAELRDIAMTSSGEGDIRVHTHGRRVACRIHDQPHRPGHVGALAVLSDRPVTLVLFDLASWT